MSTKYALPFWCHCWISFLAMTDHGSIFVTMWVSVPVSAYISIYIYIIYWHMNYVEFKHGWSIKRKRRHTFRKEISGRKRYMISDSHHPYVYMPIYTDAHIWGANVHLCICHRMYVHNHTYTCIYTHISDTFYFGMSSGRSLFLKQCMLSGLYSIIYVRADSRFAPNQWETSLQSNAVSHWLGANLESALYLNETQRDYPLENPCSFVILLIIIFV